MNHSIFTSVLRLPTFRGKYRLVESVRGMAVSPYVQTVSHDLRMELDTFEWSQLHLAEHGTAEPTTIRLLESLLSEGETFIDVGAHVGYVSLVARRLVGESGRVVAIEPQPYNCERLLRNWDLNGFENLSLHVAAAGDRDGFVMLPQQSRTDKARLSLALPMHDALPLEYEIPMMTLDRVFEKNQLSEVAVLKIDVEGFEQKVLGGMSEHISAVRNVVFEALIDEHGNFAGTRAVCGWLIERGFRVFTVTGEHWEDSTRIVENNLWASRA